MSSDLKFCNFYGFQLNRVKLVEKEKNALEGEKNKAVDFLTLENDIFRHKSRLCQYHVWVYQNLLNTWFLCSLICYSWYFLTENITLIQYFSQSWSTKTCGGQRRGEGEDLGGHQGTDREEYKDITGDGENEPGAERRWEVRHLVSSLLLISLMCLGSQTCVWMQSFCGCLKSQNSSLIVVWVWKSAL